MKGTTLAAMAALILLAGCANKPPEPRLPDDGERTPINTTFPPELVKPYEQKHYEETSSNQEG